MQRSIRARLAASLCDPTRPYKGLTWLMTTACVAGDWVTDKREGQGSCLFADGIIFQGQWTADA